MTRAGADGGSWRAKILFMITPPRGETSKLQCEGADKELGILAGAAWDIFTFMRSEVKTSKRGEDLKKYLPPGFIRIRSGGVIIDVMKPIY